MRLQEIIREDINVKHLYGDVKTRVLAALRQSAKEALSQYQEGEYYAGHVLDAISATLKSIMEEEFGQRTHHVMIATSRLNGANFVGGSVGVLNQCVLLTIEVPREWFERSPNMFWYVMRDMGNDLAAEIANTFCHEALHIEQEIRKPGAGPRKRRTARTGQNDYLTRKNEIEAHALSTALEILEKYPRDDALAVLRDNPRELLGISVHFLQFWKKVRDVGDQDAWKAYLRALHRHLVSEPARDDK